MRAQKTHAPIAKLTIAGPAGHLFGSPGSDEGRQRRRGEAERVSSGASAEAAAGPQAGSLEFQGWWNSQVHRELLPEIQAQRFSVCGFLGCGRAARPSPAGTMPRGESRGEGAGGLP